MALDYSDIGLNANLIPQDSLMGGTRDFTTGYDLASNYDRNIIGNYQIQAITASKILAGTITVQLGVGTTGGGYVRIDGANNNIIVNDGTNNRILIGYGSALF